MTSNLAPAAGRAIPGGALSALAIGLLLYLTTSLVLGSSAGSSRVFDVSLSIPSVELATAAPTNLAGDRITGSRMLSAAPTVGVLPVAHIVPAAPIATSVVVVPQSIAATAPPPASALDARKPSAERVKARGVRAKGSHYHDADERSHRLARRR
jgi:hypothetical protein